jgi:hypothetical protein
MGYEGIEQFFNAENFSQAVSGGIIGGLLAVGIVFLVLVSIGTYVYNSLAWMTIAKKVKHKKPWLAWIPFANISMWLQMGGFHWALVFLILIPILGWIALLVLMIISHWRVFEKLKYPGWLSLSIIIPKVGGILYLIVIGFVAWAKKKKKKK